MLALLGGEAEPARAVAEVVPRRAGALQIEPGQIVLGIGVAEIGRGIGEHLARPVRIGLHLRIGNALEVVAPERHEGVGDHAGLRRRRAVLGVLVGDAAEIVEGAQIVLGDAFAIGVHPAELPLRDRMAAFGGVLQRGQRVGRNGCRHRRRRNRLLQGRCGARLGRNHRDSRVGIDRRTVESEGRNRRSGP